MRKTTLWAVALTAALYAGAARADGPVPPVMVGPVVITGHEAAEMLDVLAHHAPGGRRHYRAGDSLDWLVPSQVPPTPAPGIPTIMIGATYVTGHEAEEMISKLSRMRHHGRWRAGMPLDWLGLGMPAAPAPVMAAYPVPQPMMVPVPVPVAAPVPVPVAVEARPAAPDLRRTIIGVKAQGNRDHASLGGGLLFEGRRWGVNLGVGGTVYREGADDNSRKLKLLDAHLLFAPLTGERGRIRLEAGASLAFAGGAMLLAPDLGLSGDLRILGWKHLALGLLGEVHGTSWPYTRWDAFAGAFFKLWIVRVEAGWREMRMEAELPNGVIACDKWSGPYGGLSVVF